MLAAFPLALARGFVRFVCRRLLGDFHPPGYRGEHEWIGKDRQNRSGKDQVAAVRRQNAEVRAETRQNERELTDLSEAGRDRQRRAVLVTERSDDRISRRR